MIKEKLHLLKIKIEDMGGIIDLDWCGELLYPYYEHFNDIQPEYRSGSLLAFSGLLIEWQDESGFPFRTDAKDHEFKCHCFESYLEQFLTYSVSIKKQYPNIYLTIIVLLRQLDEREHWENEFPSIRSSLFDTVRKKLTQEDVIEISNEIFEFAIKEAFENINLDN